MKIKNTYLVICYADVDNCYLGLAT